MAHEIEGNKAFYVGKPAWHELGTLLTEAPTTERAWHLACPHVYHKVDLEAVIVAANGQRLEQPITGHKAIIRDDGREIGVVGADYELVQPAEVMRFFEPFLESGRCALEAGGTLREGAQMWALAKFARQYVSDSDPIDAYLLAFTSFDGSLRHGITATRTRVVCANTLAVAQSGGVDFSTRHTRNIATRVEAVQQTMLAAEKAFDYDVEKYRQLRDKKLSRKAQAQYVVAAILGDEAAAGKFDELPTRSKTKVERVFELIETQRGKETCAADSAWRSYNAVTEYLTHEAGRTDDSRIRSLWFGDNARLNNRALQLAIAA